MTGNPENIKLEVNNIEDLNTAKLDEIKGASDLQNKLNRKLGDFDKNNFSSNIESNLTIQKSENNKYLLLWEDQEIGYISSEKKFNELKTEIGKNLNMEVIVKESQKEQKELKNEIVINNLSVDSLALLLKEESIEKIDQTRRILAEKIIKNPDKISQAVDILGEDIVKNNILHNYFLDTEGFMEEFMKKKDYLEKSSVTVNGEKLEDEERKEYRKRYRAYEEVVKQKFDLTKIQFRKVFLQNFYKNGEEFGRDLETYNKFSTRMAKLQEDDTEIARAVKEKGLVGGLGEILSKTKMGEGHLEAAKGIASLAPLVLGVWGAIEAVKKYGLGKSILGFLGLEFGAAATTGHGIFEWGTRLAYGGLDEIKAGEETEKIIKIGEGDTEKKETIGPVVFMSLILGEGKKLEDINGLKEENGELKFDIEKYKKNLPENNSKKALIANLLKQSKAEKLNKLLLSGLIKTGLNGNNFTEKKEEKTTIGSLIKEYNNDMKTGDTTETKPDTTNNKDSEKSSKAKNNETKNSNGSNKTNNKSNTENNGTKNSDGSNKTNNKSNTKNNEKQIESPEKIEELSNYFGIEKSKLEKVQKNLNNIDMNLSFIQNYKKFIENNLSPLDPEIKSKIKKIIKIRIGNIPSIIEENKNKAKNDGKSIQYYKFSIDENLKNNFNYVTHKILPSAYFYMQYKKSGKSKNDFIKKFFPFEEKPESENPYNIFVSGSSGTSEVKKEKRLKAEGLLNDAKEIFQSKITQEGKFEKGESLIWGREFIDSKREFFDAGEELEDEILERIGLYEINQDGLEELSFLNAKEKEIKDSMETRLMAGLGVIIVNDVASFTGIWSIPGAILGAGYDIADLCTNEDAIMKLLKPLMPEEYNNYKLEQVWRDQLLASIGIIPGVTALTKSGKFLNTIRRMSPNKYEDFINKFDTISRKLLGTEKAKILKAWLTSKEALPSRKLLFNEINKLEDGESLTRCGYTITKTPNGKFQLANGVEYENINTLTRVLNKEIDQVDYFSDLLKNSNQDIIKSIENMSEKARTIKLSDGKKYTIDSNLNIRYYDDNGDINIFTNFDDFFTNIKEADKKIFIGTLMKGINKINILNIRTQESVINSLIGNSNPKAKKAILDNIDEMGEGNKILKFNGKKYRFTKNGDNFELKLINKDGSETTKKLDILYNNLSQKEKKKLINKITKGIDQQRLKVFLGLENIPLKEIDGKTLEAKYTFEIKESGKVSILSEVGNNRFPNIDKFIKSKLFKESYKELIGNGIKDKTSSTVFKIIDESKIKVDFTNGNSKIYTNLDEIINNGGNDFEIFKGAVYYSKKGQNINIETTRTIKMTDNGYIKILNKNGDNIKTFKKKETFYKSKYYNKFLNNIDNTRVINNIEDIVQDPMKAAERFLKHRIKNMDDGNSIKIGDKYTISKNEGKFNLSWTDETSTVQTREFDKLNDAFKPIKQDENINFVDSIIKSQDELIKGRLLEKLGKNKDITIDGQTYRISKSSDGKNVEFKIKESNGGFRKIDNIDEIPKEVQEGFLKELVGTDGLKRLHFIDNINPSKLLSSTEKTKIKEKWGNSVLKKGVDKFNNRKDNTKSGTLARLVLGKSGQGWSWKRSIATSVGINVGLEGLYYLQSGSFDFGVEDPAQIVAEILLFKKLHWVWAGIYSMGSHTGIEALLNSKEGEDKPLAGSS